MRQMHVSTTARFSAARRTLWHRVRFQLGVGLLLSVLMPYFLRLPFEPNQTGLDSLRNSLFGSAAALISGYYAFRKMSRYPGVRASYHILPSFAISYGVVLAVFFFARLEYSRLHFASSYMVCVCWYYVTYFNLQRQQGLQIGVVPFGAVDHLFQITDVGWVRLASPADAEVTLDVIVADLRADIPEEWERFIADMAIAGTLVMHAKQMEESLTGQVAIEHLSENNFGSLIPGIVYGKVKRAGDLLFTILILPLLSPLLLLVGALVRIDSQGPILFRQQRMGHGGLPFTMYKFRTMRHGEVQGGDERSAAITQEHDDRVTRIGRFLRRYRIDELPQALNILRGEMSWIGPRPEAVPLSLWYEAELPFYRYRHIVRPGITGWAQVRQGHVADVNDVLWKLHYDFYYIKNFSFWLDLLIIAGTVRTILGGFGAR